MVDLIIIGIGIGIVTEIVGYFEIGVIMVPDEMQEDGGGIGCRGVDEKEKVELT